MSTNAFRRQLQAEIVRLRPHGNSVRAPAPFRPADRDAEGLEPRSLYPNVLFGLGPAPVVNIVRPDFRRTVSMTVPSYQVFRSPTFEAEVGSDPRYTRLGPFDGLIGFTGIPLPETP